MPKKILNIVESAYRATIEEQDDTVVWFVQAMQGGGADVAVLLCGNAVNYCVEGHDASGLSFGARRQTQPPRLDADLARLAAQGVPIRFIAEDAQERGIEAAARIAGPEPVRRADLPDLLAGFDLVLRW